MDKESKGIGKFWKRPATLRFLRGVSRKKRGEINARRMGRTDGKVGTKHSATPFSGVVNCFECKNQR